MSTGDLAILDPARPLPSFADPASRRIGTLQTLIRQEQTKAWRLSRLIERASADRATCDTKIAAAYAEIGRLEASRG